MTCMQGVGESVDEVVSHKESKEVKEYHLLPAHPHTQVPWVPGKGRPRSVIFLNIHGTQCRNERKGRASPRILECSGWLRGSGGTSHGYVTIHTGRLRALGARLGECLQRKGVHVCFRAQADCTCACTLTSHFPIAGNQGAEEHASCPQSISSVAAVSCSSSFYQHCHWHRILKWLGVKVGTEVEGRMPWALVLIFPLLPQLGE